MEQRYKMERNAVDNLIRNQQRKLHEQFKKLNNSYKCHSKLDTNIYNVIF